MRHPGLENLETALASDTPPHWITKNRAFVPTSPVKTSSATSSGVGTETEKTRSGGVGAATVRPPLSPEISTSPL
jgi:hypothetical protein